MTVFTDKIVWVTGASEGLGRALAAELAGRGATVVASARNADALESLASDCGDAVTAVPLDVTDMAAIQPAVETVLDRFGRIDVLINNAGLNMRALIHETDLAVYRRLMEVNFFGVVALTQAVLPAMRANKAGYIVVTGSPGGLFGTPLRSGYTAAKHAIHGFYECLRAEEARDGIEVSVIVPGSVRTNVTINALNGSGGLHGKMEDNVANGFSPEECAVAVADGLARRDPEIFVLQPGAEKMVALRRDDPLAFFERVRLPASS